MKDQLGRARERPASLPLLRQRSLEMLNRSPSRFLVALVLLVLAGCGGSHRTGGADPATSVPSRVPTSAVAIVGTVPVTDKSFEHWLPIIKRRREAEDSVAVGDQQADRDTVSFLIAAEWRLQEARAEGINDAALDHFVAKQTAQTQPTPGMTRSDLAYQARLNVITQALQTRHSKTTASPTRAQIIRYYANHRAQFVSPAVRQTLVIVTRTRSVGLTARAALARGESWRTVAKRWSIDSTAQIGGAFAVVDGQQAPALQSAVFGAPPKGIVGPVRIPAEAGASGGYYLFEVTGARPSAPQPVADVVPRIKRTLTEQLDDKAFSAFARNYNRRWKARTLCAPGYVVTECRNAAASTHGRGP